MNLYKREEYLKRIRGFYHDTDIIKVITGVRRCGKSSIMLMIMDEILQSGVSEENCVFIDLDSRKYSKVKTKQALEELIIDGIDTNIVFLQKKISSKEFEKGEYDLSYIK